MTPPNQPQSSLPVTVLSGYSSAGKTTLLNHLLNNQKGLRCGVVMNDMRALNLDARMIKRGSEQVTSARSEMVELNNGCICCSLRDDFVREVQRMANSGKLDYLLVEATGISEPLPLALSFEREDADGRLLGDVAHLDTLATVVDAKNFLADWDAATSLRDLGQAVDVDDGRTLADLLAEQVEFANVVVINKADLVSGEELSRLTSIVKRLNPEADVVSTMFGVAPLDLLMHSEAFDPHRERFSWSGGALGNGDADEYGVSSFVYRARRPFHPERLWDVLHAEWPGVLRSKGLFWLASRMSESGLWSQAGPVCSYQGAGRWWATVPEHEWPDDEEVRTSISGDFRGPFGDRRQELWIVGVEMDRVSLKQRLDACLLDEHEMKMGPMGWLQLADPFPNWSSEARMEPEIQLLARREPASA